MTQDEVRKLLGGYSANTLSESERTALFEAALDDQDLFNALQNEDALRELLADPVTREQVRLALEPVAAAAAMPQPARTPWRWFLSVGSLAATAAIVIGIVVWQRSPIRESMNQQSAPQQIAQKREEPKLEASQPQTELRSDVRSGDKKETRQFKPPLATAVPPPSPAPASAMIAQSNIARDQEQSAQLAGAPPLVLAAPEATSQAVAGLVAGGALYNGPIVRYSLLRSGPAGSAVRVEVVSQVAGTIALYRADAAGQWQRVFPLNSPGIPIAANTPLHIPDNPIAVRGNQDKLRLVLEPGPTATFASKQVTGALDESRAKALTKKSEVATPLVIEIPIGQN
jgi:hypothetical protein